MITPNTFEIRIIELLEKKLIIDLYLQGVNRNQIKDIVNVGTKKV
jgi:hypothetical protein